MNKCINRNVLIKYICMYLHMKIIKLAETQKERKQNIFDNGKYNLHNRIHTKLFIHRRTLTSVAR